MPIIESSFQLNESNLQPGDVIFFINLYKDLSSKSEEESTLHEYVDHVGLFVGFDETNNPRIVHSITGSKGHYYPEKVSGLCITTLRLLQNQVQDDDGRVYDVKYRVFRGAYPAITAKALEILKQQATYRIPYDEQRLAKKLELEAAYYSGDDFKRISMKAYPETGIFRSIKYAARHPFLLTRTRGDGVGRGLTCSMSVILAYQIAELLIDKKITPINPALNEWPSDKYAPVPADASLSMTYKRYLDSLKTPETMPRKEEGLKLSIHFWKGDVPPEGYRHKTFALDSKSAGAEGMFLYMKESQDAWNYLGDLQVTARQFSPNDKAMHRNKLVDAYRKFLDNISGMLDSLPVMCSPAKSPSPVPKGKHHLWWNKEDISARIFSGANNPNINQEELVTLVSTNNIRESLSKITQDLLEGFTLEASGEIIGLLLNTKIIRNVFYARGPWTLLPTFYSNKALLFEEFFKATEASVRPASEGLKSRPSIMFYFNGGTLLEELYAVFSQLLFEQFIININKQSEEQKATVITALVEKGKYLFKQSNYHGAISMYLSAQIIYSLLDNPTQHMHLQYLQLFLLKVQAFHNIKVTESALEQTMSDLILAEKRKATDTLNTLKDIMTPEVYAKFEQFPIPHKIKRYNHEELDVFVDRLASTSRMTKTL